jgi:hypothetical protein
MTRIRKRAIPSPQSDQIVINTAVKENIELINGSRKGLIDSLDTTTATAATCAAKINEILEAMQ